MTLALYMDVHVDGRVTQGLMDRGLDVLRAQEDRFDEAPDPVLLDRATELKRILVTCDKDFLVEARMRQRDGSEFTGIVFWVQDALEIGRWIDELELIAKCLGPDEIRNRVELSSAQIVPFLSPGTALCPLAATTTPSSTTPPGLASSAKALKGASRSSTSTPCSTSPPRPRWTA